MAVWHRFFEKPAFFRRALNIWPPFMGAGIVVESVSQDFHHVAVALKDRGFNRNYAGTHFGGSLFAMTDPFYMLMLIQILGFRYYVWDLKSAIHFLTPAQGSVRAEFVITTDQVERIKAATVSGDRHEEAFVVEIKNASGLVVSRVEKTLYIRLKPSYRPE